MPEKSPEEHLKECTVRLSHEGKKDHDGTGFFVAPGLILTCAHVFKKANGKQIYVWWQNQNYAALMESLPEDTDKVDLALLKISVSLPDHPWVSLDESVKTRDPLYTFGYPDQYPNGDPGTFESEGLTGDKPPLLKFKEGQVRPGFSGSPLLNERTGKVCGIIKKTRDRSSDLGGRAVPTAVIFSQFPELAKLQNPSSLVISPNPFVPLTGRLDNPQLLFGREREIRRVFEALNSGSSVALIGEREIGKSSLLQGICQQAESQLILPRKPIYLNLQLVYDEQDFYEALCSEIGIEVCKGNRLARALSKQRPRLLLVLDEVEKMTWDGFTNQLRGQLRGLAEGSDAPLRLVVAASTSLDLLFPDSYQIGMTSPFKGICIEEWINLWDEVTVRAFISSRLAPTPIRFSEAEIIKLVRESRGHPKQLMNLCYQTYNNYSIGVHQ